ncbi:MAG: ROK family protein [Anaerolineae bacterium]
MTQPVTIALDVGGSSVKSGIVTASRTVEAIQHMPINSKGSAQHIFGTFAEVIEHHLRVDLPVEGIGIGFPSPFDYAQGICLIEGVDKYEAIFGVAVGEALQARITQPNLPIRFRNDAEAALVGEARYGAGKPYQRFIGLTLGTGMGSSFIRDGVRVEQGAGVPEGGFLFPVIFRGKPADEWFGTRGLLRRLERDGTSFDSVAQAATQAQHSADVRASFTRFGADLATFVAPYLRDFDAQALLVTGGIAKAYALFGGALEQGVPVPVVRGSLGAQAALLGAADLILAGD